MTVTKRLFIIIQTMSNKKKGAAMVMEEEKGNNLIQSSSNISAFSFYRMFSFGICAILSQSCSLLASLLQCWAPKNIQRIKCS